MLASQTKISILAAVSLAALTGLAPAPAVNDVNPFLPAATANSLCGTKAAGPARMQMASVPDAAAVSAEDPPLYGDLGTYSLKITTANPKAQAYFDQGLALVWGFNHGEAVRAFKAAQKADPDCAMCYWGEALAYGPNINAAMDDKANNPAIAATEKAFALKVGATAREQALIVAMTKRYDRASKADRKTLDKAYSDAMVAAARAFPDDNDIAAFAAESIMNTTPWAYWEQPLGIKPLPGIATAMELIEGVFARNPDHAGAIHLYIHLTESSNRPERAEKGADKLADLVPGSGHLVHMPGHTYYRLGRFIDSVKLNIRAVEVDEAYQKKAGADAFYLSGYYPHNVHFVLTSAFMAGDRATTLAWADKLTEVLAKAPATSGGAQLLRASTHYARGLASADPLALVAPPADQPLTWSAWAMMRGIALARSGNIREAEAIARKLEALPRNAQIRKFEANGAPAKSVTNLSALMVQARIAEAKGNVKKAEAILKRAIVIEDKLPYTEPPYWYMPVRQALGGLYLRAGRADEATEAFRATLARGPNNGWALYGMFEASRLSNDKGGMDIANAALAKSWSGPRDWLSPGVL